MNAGSIFQCSARIACVSNAAIPPRDDLAAGGCADRGDHAKRRVVAHGAREGDVGDGGRVRFAAHHGPRCVEAGGVQGDRDVDARPGEEPLCVCDRDEARVGRFVRRHRQRFSGAVATLLHVVLASG